jgi:hypothetical protein
MLASQPDNLAVDWDPLQGDYQAIVEICNEACSKVASRESHPDIFEPERIRARNLEQTSDVEQISDQAGMPPPQRFNRRSRNPFVG